jgi:rubrerythrin
MEQKIKSIALALINEVQERNFYLSQSNKTDNPVGRSMFIRIAEDEEAHYQRLKKIHEELSLKGTWPETVTPVIKKTDLMKTLLQLAGASAAIPAATRDDIEALKIAIDFESKGFGFYTGLSRDAEVPSEKEFFKLLASMEREHLLSLQETMHYFESPGDWFAEREKPCLDGQ